MNKREIFNKFATDRFAFCDCCYKIVDQVIIITNGWDFFQKGGYASLCKKCFLKGEQDE